MFEALEMTPIERRAAKILVSLSLALLAVLALATVVSLILQRITVWSTLGHTLGCVVGFLFVVGIPLAHYKIRLLGYEISRRYGREPYSMVLAVGQFSCATIVLVCMNALGRNPSLRSVIIAYLIAFLVSVVVTFALARATFPILGSKYK